MFGQLSSDNVNEQKKNGQKLRFGAIERWHSTGPEIPSSASQKLANMNECERQGECLSVSSMH